MLTVISKWENRNFEIQIQDYYNQKTEHKLKIL